MESVTKARLSEALQLLAGDRNNEQAWEVVFAGAWGTGLSAANRVLRGQLDVAKDVTQEAFQRIIQYCDFKKLQDSESFLSYFRAVCRNAGLNALRRLIPESVNEVSFDEFEMLSARVNRPDTPEQVLRAQQLVDELLKSLDPADQELMKLLLEGYSLAEIASRVGLSYVNAGVRLHRLRDALRKYIILNGL
jgi:RNA polymerase sigma factor (sigma-70 family)